MMLLNRPIGLSLLFIALGSARSQGADSAAEAVLEGKGLAKSGRVYVIEAEAPVLEKMKGVKAAYASYASAVDRQDAADQFASQIVEMEQQRLAMQSNLNALNQGVTQQQRMASYGRRGSRYTPNAMNSPLVAERDQAKMALAQIANNQKVTKAQVLSPKDRKTLDDQAKAKEDAFKRALEELRPMVDEVEKKYADLKADEAVKKALDDLSKASKTVVKTGPSEPFAAGARALAQAERQYLGKRSTAPNKKAKGKR
jgi:paraquat-inducible protein B